MAVRRPQTKLTIPISNTYFFFVLRIIPPSWLHFLEALKRKNSDYHKIEQTRQNITLGKRVEKLPSHRCFRFRLFPPPKHMGTKLDTNGSQIEKKKKK